MTKIIIHRPETPKIENLKKMYDVFNKIFTSDELFYTTSDVERLKKDKNNVFLN